MKPAILPLPQLVGRALLDRFPALEAVSGFKSLLVASGEKIETGEWRVAGMSGLHAISLYFRGVGLIEVACIYRDQREEFEFLTREVEQEEIAPTLIRFLEMVLALPSDALTGKRTIRAILDYRECKGIY